MAIFLIRSLENWSWKKSFLKLLVYLFSVTDELCRLSMLHREKQKIFTIEVDQLIETGTQLIWCCTLIKLEEFWETENWGIVEQNILILVLCGWNLRNTGSYFHIATQ